MVISEYSFKPMHTRRLSIAPLLADYCALKHNYKNSDKKQSSAMEPDHKVTQSALVVHLLSNIFALK